MSDRYIHRTAEDFRRLMPAGRSGNEVNGLGEAAAARPRPFFWHPPHEHEFGELQKAIIDHHRQSPEIARAYSRDADRGPRPALKAAERVVQSAAEWTSRVRTFALANEADLVGITPLRPEYVYDGYEIRQPWLVMIGVSMDHEQLAQAPASIENVSAGLEVAVQYNRAARACRKLANFILESGHEAQTYPGPMATALNMIPAAIAAGLGELGKHGSMINRQFGSSFRLSAVATDLPLIADSADVFGADEFCRHCQICSRACPPDAISPIKQMVRGNLKWYVDFDRCIPYFGETFACGICLAVCPWSKPGAAPRLAEKMAHRKERLETASEKARTSRS